MNRRLIFIPAVLLGVAATPALASTQTSEPRFPQTAPASDFVRLAQNQEIEVYYDENGNRVITDAMTGEVIAVQPRKFNRERERAVGERRRPPRDRDYYSDRTYDDVEDDGYRRARARRYQAPGDDYARGSDVSDYDYRDDGQRDQFPDAPPPPAGQEPLRSTKIDRAPLKQPGAVAAVPQEEVTSLEPEFTGTVRSESQEDLAPKPSLKKIGRESVAELQVLLDRAGASSGVIDGRFGSNLDKALAAYAEITGVKLRSTDQVAIKAGLEETGGDAFANYEITPQDVAGPYVASVPVDYSEKAKLERMAYTSVTEALAERFHMDEDYLKSINPGLNFNRPGTLVRVVNFGSNVTTKVKRIIADKGKKQVRAYDANGRLVAAYPATIGSSDTPSPSGTHAVTRAVFNPNYTYNPKVNFKQGENDKILTIPPGPNGPVGSVWIALDKPTYGIHGTPDPSKIGKTESHGCVRLTNFDAQELAKLVSPGVEVEFVE